MAANFSVCLGSLSYKVWVDVFCLVPRRITGQTKKHVQNTLVHIKEQHVRISFWGCEGEGEGE